MPRPLRVELARVFSRVDRKGEGREPRGRSLRRHSTLDTRHSLLLVRTPWDRLSPAAQCLHVAFNVEQRLARDAALRQMAAGLLEEN